MAAFIDWTDFFSDVEPWVSVSRPPSKTASCTNSSVFNGQHNLSLLDLRWRSGRTKEKVKKKLQGCQTHLHRSGICASLKVLTGRLSSQCIDFGQWIHFLPLQTLSLGIFLGIIFDFVIPLGPRIEVHCGKDGVYAEVAQTSRQSYTFDSGELLAMTLRVGSGLRALSVTRLAQCVQRVKDCSSCRNCTGQRDTIFSVRISKKKKTFKRPPNPTDSL